MADALNMKQEVVSLCDQVARYGFRSPENIEQVKFIDLYKINERISSRFFKILDFSRKCRILEFEEENPKPGLSDEMIITLLRTNTEIQTYFKHTGQLLPNQTSGNLMIEVDCSTLAYYDWLTNVKECDNCDNAALHLGGLSNKNKKESKNKSKKVSYHVVTKEADLSDLCLSWMTLDQWTADSLDTYLEATELLEPEVIFKLYRVKITHIVILAFPIIHNLPNGRTEDFNQEHFYEKVIQGEQEKYLERVKILTVNLNMCQKEKKIQNKDYAEIRPLVRLYKRSTPSPTRQNKPEPLFDWRKFVQTESRKPSIKFSTSTVLYTPPKPSYDNIFRSDALKENFPGPERRAKSEFRDRFSRKYISLYN